MMQLRLNQFIDSLRQGIWAGFVAGLIIIFLILLGVPVNLESIAIPSILLVMVIFAVRLARRLYGCSLSHLINNALAMGIVAAILAYLLMSMINHWQAVGIDEKQYFYNVSSKTMTVLSGVPDAELDANPERNPLTEEYPEGATLRTNPMRLTFDSDTGLELFGLNLVIGGFYGFMLLLIMTALLGAVLTWAAVALQIGRYRTQLVRGTVANPLSRRVALMLPLIFFALLWLMEKQGSFGPVLAVGSSSREIQLLLGFGIVLWGLVALRSAQPSDWGLAYPVRLGICVALIAVLIALGIWRVASSDAAFAALSDDPDQSEVLSIVILIALGLAAAAQNAWALRQPGHFEIQLAGTQSLLALLLMPLFFDQYQNQVMMLVGINAMLGLGLNIVVGYAGLLDLGYVAFFGIGAYAYAFLSSNQLELNSADSKFAGNKETVAQLAGWMVITVIVTLLVVNVGLRYWRQRQSAAHTDEYSRPLINFPAHPARNGTVLLTITAIVLSVIVASILDNAGVYQDIFETASPFVIGLIVGTIVAGLSGILLGIPVLQSARGLSGDCDAGLWRDHPPAVDQSARLHRRPAGYPGDPSPPARRRRGSGDVPVDALPRVYRCRVGCVLFDPAPTVTHGARMERHAQ